MAGTNKPISKFRHWKQRFEPGAKFIFRRGLTYGPKTYQPGDLIPDELQNNRKKLRLFWDSGYIELAEFEVAKSPKPESPKPKRGRGRPRKVVSDG